MEYTKGENGIWHPVNYAGTFVLQAAPYYGEPDLFDYNEFHDSHYTEDEAKANVKLASKAPEMHEALKLAKKIIHRQMGKGLVLSTKDYNKMFDPIKELD